MLYFDGFYDVATLKHCTTFLLFLIVILQWESAIVLAFSNQTNYWTSRAVSTSMVGPVITRPLFTVRTILFPCKKYLLPEKTGTLWKWWLWPWNMWISMNIIYCRQPHGAIIGQGSTYHPNYPPPVNPTTAGIQRLTHPTMTGDQRSGVHCGPAPPPNHSVITRAPPSCGAGK